MLRLLLIDDDQLILRSLARSLRLDGHSVHTIQYAHEVQLEHLSEYDAIVTDLEMPKFGGREVLQHLESCYYPMRRVALHSANGNAPSVASEYGCHCVAKGGNLRLWLANVAAEREMERQIARMDRRLSALEAPNA